MGRMFQRVSNHRGDIIVGILKCLTYLGLFFAFYRTMLVHNWPLAHPSRTLFSTMLTYVAVAFGMHAVYGGYDIGKKKSKPIITNMYLGSVVTDLVTYLELQIMNVNENRNAYLKFFSSEDFPWLLICMGIQAVFLMVIVRFGNHLYFSIYPPKKCLLILGNLGERAAIEDKLNHYRLQWHVKDAASWDDPKIARRIESAEVVFIASVPEGETMRLLKMCYDLHRDVLCKAQLQDIMLSSAQQVVVDDAPFLEMDYHKMTLWQRIVKRLMDIVLSMLALIITSPIMALCALAIKLEDGGSVIFRQERMTVRGRSFTIRKFRTMKAEASLADHFVSTQESDDRITKVGRFLRKTRLDELPQFVNIFLGDMTLVGPRPEMIDNITRYKADLPTFVYREKVKAGLTGYAQIEGKYNTSPEDKLMLDLMYIENFSLWNDVRLIFRTLTVLFRPDSTEGFRETEKPGSSKNH